MRALLLPASSIPSSPSSDQSPERTRSESLALISADELRARGRWFERSETLVSVLTDSDPLQAADSEARAQGDAVLPIVN